MVLAADIIAAAVFPLDIYLSVVVIVIARDNRLGSLAGSDEVPDIYCLLAWRAILSRTSGPAIGRQVRITRCYEIFEYSCSLDCNIIRAGVVSGACNIFSCTRAAAPQIVTTRPLASA